MDRRAFISGLAGGLVAAPARSEAQQPGRMYGLGILSPGSRLSASAPTVASSLPPPLRELGYAVGQNLTVEQRFAEGKLDRLPGLARELAQLRLDALFAVSPVAVDAARRATGTIPIVMLLAYSDPVELGFVTSLARPGGNITGVVLAAEPTMAGKRLELIKQAVPRATRIAFLGTNEASSRTQVQWAEKVAQSLGVKLITVEARGNDYGRAFATMAAERADALLVGDTALFGSDHPRIIELAAQYRLPAIYSWREYVEVGGLMAYGGSLSGVARRVAAYVDRIFKGAKPADLPVERATVLELAINRKTAKTLGLTIPPSLLLQADQVIE